MFVSNRYRVNFVVQCRYATWQVPIEKKNPVLLKPFINTFNHFTGGVIIFKLFSTLQSFIKSNFNSISLAFIYKYV